MNQLTAYTLRLGDNCLVLSQRFGEWCGHAPELEIDLALANIGLDLLGQARNFLSYAAELAGEGDEDTLAFTRDERQFSNLLLVEQPNGNFADTIARQYFIDAWHVALFTRLMESRDPQLAAISAKAIKEARYHLRFSRGWLERLGNGTDVSGQKMQQAINKLWRFTAELFDADDYGVGGFGGDFFDCGGLEYGEQHGFGVLLVKVRIISAVLLGGRQLPFGRRRIWGKPLSRQPPPVKVYSVRSSHF